MVYIRFIFNCYARHLGHTKIRDEYVFKKTLMEYGIRKSILKIVWGCKNHRLSMKCSPFLGPNGINKMSLAPAVNLNDAYADIPGWIIELPDRLRTSEIWNEAVHMSPISFVFVSKGFTHSLCFKAWLL